MAFRGRLNDARYPGRAAIFYPFHPLFGCEYAVHRRHGFGGTQQIELQLKMKRLAVPVWMSNQDQCENMTWGVDPHCSWESLLKLMRLLQQSGL